MNTYTFVSIKSVRKRKSHFWSTLKCSSRWSDRSWYLYLLLQISAPLILSASQVRKFSWPRFQNTQFYFPLDKHSYTSQLCIFWEVILKTSTQADEWSLSRTRAQSGTITLLPNYRSLNTRQPLRNLSWLGVVLSAVSTYFEAQNTLLLISDSFHWIQLKWVKYSSNAQ